MGLPAQQQYLYIEVDIGKYNTTWAKLCFSHQQQFGGRDTKY
jgi:hypothetical protein